MKTQIFEVSSAMRMMNIDPLSIFGALNISNYQERVEFIDFDRVVNISVEWQLDHAENFAKFAIVETYSAYNYTVGKSCSCKV
jgi:hypothetical protein